MSESTPLIVCATIATTVQDTRSWVPRVPRSRFLPKGDFFCQVNIIGIPLAQAHRRQARKYKDSSAFADVSLKLLLPHSLVCLPWQDFIQTASAPPTKNTMAVFSKNLLEGVDCKNAYRLPTRRELTVRAHRGLGFELSLMSFNHNRNEHNRLAQEEAYAHGLNC
jgi:hypothetical protein